MPPQTKVRVDLRAKLGSSATQRMGRLKSNTYCSEVDSALIETRPVGCVGMP